MDFEVSIGRMEELDWRKATDLFYTKLPFGFVSDLLRDAYKQWIPQIPVAIFSGTGTGKNTFIENILIPYAVAENASILLLSNRVALGRQEKRRLCGLFGLERQLDDYTDQGLDKFTKIANLRVISYQQLGAWINYSSGELRELIKEEFLFVVIDEAHFFTADCGFNAFSDMVLHFITQNFRSAIRIYMTATPDVIFPVLRHKDGLRGWGPRYNCLQEYFCWRVYEFEPDFSYIHAFGFDTDEDLIDIIRNSTQKWLIFCESVRHGQELVDSIGTDSVLVTAASKDSKADGYATYHEIVNTEQYSARILITTAVLENGLNLKDRKLENVVIYSNDKTRFQQMVGRVRRMEGKTLNVYIPDVDEKSAVQNLNRTERLLRACEKFSVDPTEFFEFYLKDPQPICNVKGAVTILHDSRAHLNKLFPLKLWYSDLVFWRKIVANYELGQAFPVLEEKFKWLDQTFFPSCIVGIAQRENAIKQLELFLTQHISTDIVKEKQSEFREQFSDLYREAYGRRRDEKGNGAYGLNVIKKLLEEQKIPYQIENPRTGWRIIRREEAHGTAGDTV